MDQQGFNSILEALNEQEGVEEAFLLSAEGKIVFKSGDFQLNDEEAKKILQAWKNKEPSLTFQNSRFAVLKNDELQLAAKNIAGGKGNIVGSITRDGIYLIAHTRDESMILLEWSIFINKVAWGT